MMIRRLAIIPARGGSKRIVNKNIRDFCGKPMISHVLETARSSDLFKCIHVSTESPDIRKAVEKLGATIHFPRPLKLADDKAPIMPVLKYVTDTFSKRGELFDEVWLLMACAPLIDANDLKRAAKLFTRAGGKTPLLAVAEYPVPIEWAFNCSDDSKLVPVEPGMFARPSQELKKKYFDAGAFSIFPTEVVQSSEGAGSDMGFIAYVLPKNKAVDIDDEADWDIAEALFRLKSNVNSRKQAMRS